MIGLITTALIAVLLLGSVFFTLVSAIGMIRLPDVYTRSHVATETDTLGAGLALLAVAVALGVQPQTVLVVFLILFMFITNPTAAHAVARAADEAGVTPVGESGSARTADHRGEAG